MRAVAWPSARSWHAEEWGFYLECDGKLPDDFILGDFTIPVLEMASLGWKEANSEPRAPVGKSQYELNEKLLSRKRQGGRRDRMTLIICRWNQQISLLVG